MKEIIKKFVASGGKHCITNSLKQIFYYYGIDISEEMIFGLGSGFNFFYMNILNSPMISGRIKPFEFENNIASRLNIKIDCKRTSSNIKAFTRLKEMISNKEPVLIYVDMAYLNYLNLQNNHFGGHTIVVFGFDDDCQSFYVSDRDSNKHGINTSKGIINEDFHIVSFSELENARSSKHPPYAAQNKWLEFNFENYVGVDKTSILLAVQKTCNNMLNPPTKFLGLDGILKFSREVLSWNKYDEYKVKNICSSNYFMINKTGGTGGGIFRDMYGKFLIEIGEILKNTSFTKNGIKYRDISNKWDYIAEVMWDISKGNIKIVPFEDISHLLEELYIEEKKIITNIYDTLRTYY